eukprot:TRINITY_DN1434_c0_g1_i6.p1 TRINITY_DN1434_c0_g1~~TRINITY_DN1434_c0_g1_i6.p1  ORF type:complete len:213 (+),score=12.15 TRINITY_DN1434_c0_g1_i6:80-718(+)
MNICADRWYDPPLTLLGKQQAKLVAEKELLQKHEKLNYTKMFVSPLLRTIETAEQLGAVLGLDGHCIPGLSQCAAAIQFNGIKHTKYPSEKEIKTKCPRAKFHLNDKTIETFVQSCTRLAKLHPGEHLLIVTHREGLKYLSQMAGFDISHFPYCAVMHAEYDHNVTKKCWSVDTSTISWTKVRERPPKEAREQAEKEIQFFKPALKRPLVYA